MLNKTNMKEWFKDSEIFYSDFYDKDSFGSRIKKNSDPVIPSINSVVIIGFNEMISDPIRAELYKTSYSFEKLDITDLGNLNSQDTGSMIDILQYFIKKDVNIIIPGMTEDQVLHILKSLDHGFKNVIFIEKQGDLFFSNPVKEVTETSHYINKAKLLCYQSHLLHSNKMEGLSVNQSMRLGEFRNNYRQAEPLIRDGDIAFFNMDSVRYSEIPGLMNTSPSGLTSEESCQIMKYFGLNTRSNLFGIIGYEPKFDFHSQAAMVISQMIWYYLEGLENRTSEDMGNSASVQTFMVELSDYNITLKFLQSRKTGRWWVEIPLKEEGEAYMLPCTEEDFDRARNNDLSYRIFSELGL